jgi:hypothetical protein
MPLYDEIQARLRKQATDLNSMAPAVGTQAALTDAARAGTGRATGSGAPRASNVGEQTQAAAGVAQASQVAARLAAASDRLSQQQQTTKDAAAAGTTKLAAGQAAFDASQTAGANARATTRQAATDSLGASLAGQEARGTKAATQGFQTKTADMTAEAGNAADDLFAQFRQGTQELAFRKDAAQLEQSAQQLALRDRAYVDQLVQIGTLRRLEDENAWRGELQRLTLGDKLASAIASVGFKVDLNADQRAFNEQMAGMDMDTALMVLNSELQGKNAATIMTGLGSLANTGAKAKVASDDADKAEDARAAALSNQAPDLSNGSSGDLRASERY